MSHQENEKDDPLSPNDETSSPMNSPFGTVNCDFNQENRSNINEISYKPASDSDTHNQSSSDDEQNKNNSSSSNIQAFQGLSESYSQPAFLPGISNLSSSSQSQKRPMNAFLIFCKRHRSVVKQKYPHLENRSITKILGEWWAGLDSEEKQKYTELARTYKEAFMRANPHFKWYKTDIRTPSVFQPSSPPQSHTSQSSLPSSEKFNHFNSSLNVSQSQPSNSTPKPPKKRYLENLENTEFKGPSGSKGALPSTSQSTSNVSTLNIGGPPVLDIDTMNRVIENALRDVQIVNHQVCCSAENINKDVLASNLKDVTICKLEKEENQLISNDSRFTSSQSNLNFDLTNSMPSNLNCSNNVNNNSTASHITTQQSSFANSEDKPLNLSSSKVLHTSNQQIIDHFIDKCFESSQAGNSLPPEMLNSLTKTSLSSLPASLPSSAFASTNNSVSIKQNRKERSCKGKRYLEMLSVGKLAKRVKNNSLSFSAEEANNSNSGSFFGNESGNGNGNESNGDETNFQVGISKNNLTISNGSKWVSGGFDLEEHIAALPQLGDTHLMNALNSKANKLVNGTKSGNENDNKSSSISVNNHTNSIELITSSHLNSNVKNFLKEIDEENQIYKHEDVEEDTEENVEEDVEEDEEGEEEKKRGKGKEDEENRKNNEKIIESNFLGNLKILKQKDESKLILETQNSDTNVDRSKFENSDNDLKREKDEIMINYNELKTESNYLTNDSTEIKSQRRDVYIHTSQGIECDGLAALAEVALQQAHCNAISSSSSS